MNNEDQLKQILRRQDNIEKTLNLIYKDRDILEDISIRLGAVEDKVRYQSDRIASLEKNTKADIADVQDTVTETKDNMQEVVKAMT